MPRLKRVISAPLLVFYGLGNILGAGIYVLVGEIAGVAGYQMPLAFALASLLVAPTALSYSELAARYPVSAGEAVYLHQAFALPGLSILVGLLIASAGMVSTATLARGFAGYLRVFVEVPEFPVLALLVLALGALCAWGISQSVRVAAALTLVEIAGLVLVIWVGRGALADLDQRAAELLPSAEPGMLAGIIAGAFLAFYAFIGFEDMVNVAEEVRDPGRALPRAILTALVAATALYLLVALVAVLALPPAELAASSAPLAAVYASQVQGAPTLITSIGLLAAINGALVQIVMASRIVYGMSNQGWLPAQLSRVSARTGTPLPATALVTLIVLALALWLPLVTLAQITSFIILIVFALMHASLWVIKGREPRVAGAPAYPRWVPMLGLIASLGFAVASLLAVL